MTTRALIVLPSHFTNGIGSETETSTENWQLYSQHHRFSIFQAIYNTLANEIYIKRVNNACYRPNYKTYTATRQA